jgi:hypothetical protein
MATGLVIHTSATVIGKLTRKKYRQRRRYHLKRHGHESHEQPYSEGTRDRAPVQVPEIRVAQQRTEQVQVFVIAHLVRVRQVTPDHFFAMRH